MGTQIKTPRPKIKAAGSAGTPEGKPASDVEKANRTLPVRIRVDTPWFKERMAYHGLSLRALAKKIRLEASAVSLMLRGMRKMSVEEAGRIAHELGEPVEAVLKAAGVDVKASSNTVRVLGIVEDGDCVFEGGSMGSPVVPRPSGAGDGVRALRIQGGQWDGWVIYHHGAQGVTADAVGRLCIVQVVGEELERLRWVSRGYDEGFWNLAGLVGGKVESARLLSASPVLWMKQ